jgi:hypothetical protein
MFHTTTTTTTTTKAAAAVTSTSTTTGKIIIRCILIFIRIFGEKIGRHMILHRMIASIP